MPESHPKFDERDFNPSRPGRLLSQRAYNYVRKLQLEYRLTHGHEPYHTILNTSDHPILNFPVLLGYEDEAVVVYNKNPLGRGSFGTVYLGISMDTGKSYAVKVQELEMKKKYAIDATFVETQCLKDVGNYVDSYFVNDIDSFIHFTVQKLAQGKTLDKTLYLKVLNDTGEIRRVKNKLPMESYFDMAIDSCLAIDRMHNNGWFHGDIAMKNIMWDPKTKQSMLVDFGLAVKREKNGLGRGGFGGTLRYIAPEHFKSVGEKYNIYTTKSEMYAFGIMALELFSPKPFNPSAVEPLNYFINMKIKKGVPKYLVQHFKEILGDTKAPSYASKRLRAVLKSMIDVDPKRRPSFKKAYNELNHLKQLYLKERKAEAEKNQIEDPFAYSMPALTRYRTTESDDLICDLACRSSMKLT